MSIKPKLARCARARSWKLRVYVAKLPGTLSDAPAAIAALEFGAVN
jgi:hypothetical protein